MCVHACAIFFVRSTIAVVMLMLFSCVCPRSTIAGFMLMLFLLFRSCSMQDVVQELESCNPLINNVDFAFEICQAELKSALAALAGQTSAMLPKLEVVTGPSQLRGVFAKETIKSGAMQLPPLTNIIGKRKIHQLAAQCQQDRRLFHRWHLDLQWRGMLFWVDTFFIIFLVSMFRKRGIQHHFVAEDSLALQG